MAAERYLIGGVVYVPVEGESLTIEHDVWLLGRLHEAGMTDLEVRKDEKAEDWARRVIAELAASGRTLLVLAGLVMPETAPRWSPALAAETAEAIGAASDEESRATVNGLIIASLIGFFGIGATSASRMQTSSSREDRAAPSPPNPASSENRTARGPGLFVRLPAAITRGRSKSSVPGR